MNTTDYLIGADQTGSVMNSLTRTSLRHSYGPFGQTSTLKPGRPGFNGAYLEGAIDIYLLGNGYRAYSPKLRRFISPDALSPFGQGGLNSYCYCFGDPLNAVDPTGHMPKPTGIKKTLHSIIKNNNFTDTYTNSTRFERALHEMGNMDSDGIAGFLIKKGDVEAIHVGHMISAFEDPTWPDPWSMVRMKKRSADARLLLNAFDDNPAIPKVLIASNISLGASQVPRHVGHEFVLTVLDRDVVGISQAMHLRARQILQRAARKIFGASPPAWYLKSLYLNRRVMTPSRIKEIRRSSI